MKIAVLGWGSLIWDQRNLSIVDDHWYIHGPSLPIEFARISNGGRLTLVIKPDWKEVTTLYAICNFADLDAAIENLRIREDTVIGRIGFYNFNNGDSRIAKANEFMISNLITWQKNTQVDAVIWTDLPENFKEARNLVYNLGSINEVLKGFNKEQFGLAKIYIQNTPKQILTKYRTDIEQMILELSY